MIRSHGAKRRNEGVIRNALRAEHTKKLPRVATHAVSRTYKYIQVFNSNVFPAILNAKNYDVHA